MKLLIVAALWPEIAPLARALEAKPCEIGLPYRVLEDGSSKIRLAVTGVGSVAMAGALGALIALWRPDIVLNLGSAAGREEGIFRIHAVSQEKERRSYYPDLILPEHSSLATRALYSKDGIWKPEELGDEEQTSSESTLYDMEGYAFCQIAKCYLGPERIHLLKWVSDAGLREGERLNALILEKGMQRQLPEILAYLEALRSDYSALLDNRGEIEDMATERELERMVQEIQASASMRQQLLQIITYVSLARVNWREVWERLREEGRIPCASRREGKLLLAELEGALCESSL